MGYCNSCETQSYLHPPASVSDQLAVYVSGLWVSSSGLEGFVHITSIHMLNINTNVCQNGNAAI